MKTQTSAAVLGNLSGCYAFNSISSTMFLNIHQALEKIDCNNIQHMLGIINAFQLYTTQQYKESITLFSQHLLDSTKYQKGNQNYNLILDQVSLQNISENEIIPIEQKYLESEHSEKCIVATILYLFYALDENYAEMSKYEGNILELAEYLNPEEDLKARLMLQSIILDVIK